MGCNIIRYSFIHLVPALGMRVSGRVLHFREGSVLIPDIVVLISYYCGITCYCRMRCNPVECIYDTFNSSQLYQRIVRRISGICCLLYCGIGVCGSYPRLSNGSVSICCCYTCLLDSGACISSCNPSLTESLVRT